MPAHRNSGLTLAPVAEPRAGAGYDRFFRDALDNLHSERRYRVFADIARISGRVPTAKVRVQTHDVRTATEHESERPPRIR